MEHSPLFYRFSGICKIAYQAMDLSLPREDAMNKILGTDLARIWTSKTSISGYFWQKTHYSSVLFF
jgi:hypothetical protein